MLGKPGLELGEVEAIGTGQMSQSYRVPYHAAARTRDRSSSSSRPTDETSRATGVGMGAYLREITFYRELADRIGGPLAGCHLAVYDPAEGWFTLVLEDVDGARPGRPDRRLHARAGAASR